MGRYYGIVNLSKNQKVSHYWKGDKYCNVHQVMHQLKWDHDDNIFVKSYADAYLMEYDEETEQMELVDIEIMDDNYNGSRQVDEEDAAEFTKYGFDEDNHPYDAYNHVPVWENNSCKVCGYHYDENKLGGYEEIFNGTFFMN